MRRFSILLVLLALAVALPAGAQQRKRAQTGMKFIATSLDARAAALGNAMTAVDAGASSLFYNPAGMASQDNFLTVGASQLQFIADINYSGAALNLAPGGGRYGVVGFSLVHVDYGTIEETIFANNDQSYEDLGTFSPSAYSVGVGYARALTDRFSVGGHIKYVAQDLGNPVERRGEGDALIRAEAQESVLAYDFGMLYRTPLRSMLFAVTARNFAPEVSYAEEGFQLPIELRIGVSLDLAALGALDPDMHDLLLAIDTNKPRDFTEQISIGAEYGFMKTLYLRAGYTRPTDEQGVSLGAGIQQSIRGVGFGADYAYTDFGVFNQFGRVHRLSLRFSI